MSNNEDSKEEYFECDGFLFIGDPHLTSYRPSRRKDRNFGDIILKKIAAAIDIANQKKLQPIFLGDMFNRPVEDDESLKTRLLRILMSCWCKPLSALGNHDIAHASIGDGDSIAYLAQTGALKLAHTTMPFGIFMMGGKKVAVGSTPHGETIPTDITGYFDDDYDASIWITHHDVAFEGAYPGAHVPHEIKGCKLVVNGHMHLYKGILNKGKTDWFNPGNITRMAIDAADHVPRVWEMDKTGTLIPHVLPHEKETFDFTGLLVDAISPGEIPAEGETPEDERKSTFVELLAAERPEDLERTDDGALLRETIETKFKRDSTDKSVKYIVRSLLDEVANA